MSDIGDVNMYSVYSRMSEECVALQYRRPISSAVSNQCKPTHLVQFLPLGPLTECKLSDRSDKRWSTGVTNGGSIALSHSVPYGEIKYHPVYPWDYTPYKNSRNWLGSREICYCNLKKVVARTPVGT